MSIENQVINPPLYDRPGNLLRKMALLKRHIDDIKNALYYYGWVFTEFSEMAKLL